MRVIVVVGRLFDGEGLDRLPVEQHHELVRTGFPQPADESFQIPREQDLDLVFAVLGKRIRGRYAAARAQRQPGQLIFLREIGSRANDVALQIGLRAPHRQAADFLGG